MSNSLFNCSTALIYSSSSLASCVSFDCVAPIIQSTVLCLTRISSVSISLFRFSSSYSTIYMASPVLSLSLSLFSKIHRTRALTETEEEEEKIVKEESNKNLKFNSSIYFLRQLNIYVPTKWSWWTSMRIAIIGWRNWVLKK